MCNGTPTAGWRDAVSAIWIDHAGALPTAPDPAPLGLDTEFMRRNTFHPQLALAQVAHAGECWLIDPLAYDASTDLRGLIDGRVCVMHSAGEDLEALAPLIGEAPICLFDTQIAAALCGMGSGLSYQKLVADLVHVDLPKTETRSDWLQRPLTPSQLEYAAQDVTYLAELHARLAAELRRRGRDAWHAEDCARLVTHARRHLAEPDAQPQRSFHGAADWPRPTIARLRRVLLWRETTARSLDKPRPWVLDDAHALALSHQPPASAQELFERVKGQRSLRGPQRGELLALLQARATPEELDTLAPIPAPPRGEARRALDAMREVVHAVADASGLPPGLLCPRRLLEEFVATRAWPAGLTGWREGLLQPRLTALLPA